MSKGLTTEGTVMEALPKAMYRVRLPQGQVVTAHMSSQLKFELGRLLPGARVTVELSPYNPGRGRIVEHN